MSEAILRRFARDQWVRIHGTPRVTVLVGERAKAMWQHWLRVGELQGTLVDGALADAVPEATERAIAKPAVPIAISCTAGELARWRADRHDRLAAMVDEGVVEIPDEAAASAAAAAPAGPTAPAGPKRAAKAKPARRRVQLFDARSAAEAALLEALEATAATAGRFELNGYLSVRFGGKAAEVDLLSRQDRIAIEIDGFHHFGDPDAYRRDRRKDVLLQTQGLLVIRVLAEDVMRDPRPTVTEVCRALAYRRGGAPRA